jgi:histidine triad (HIT) family protein
MNVSYDSNNVFAKILRGEVPCKKVYEDDQVLAFHDIFPKADVHVLVIPKAPYTCFSDFTTHAAPGEVVQFLKTVTKIATDVGGDEAGFRLITNNGAGGGQEVPHFHVHILMAHAGKLPGF